MATAGQQTPPSTSERIDLSLNGLGEKKLSFPKEGNSAEVHETILVAFPALGEGYEILCAGEGRSKQLLLIPMPPNGFSVSYLQSVLGQAKGYLRPLQRDIVMETRQGSIASPDKKSHILPSQEDESEEVTCPKEEDECDNELLHHAWESKSGAEGRLMPSYNSSVVYTGMMKIMGKIIAHSIVQCGVGFPYLSLVCYWYLITGDVSKAISYGNTEDVRDIGYADLIHKLLDAKTDEDMALLVLNRQLLVESLMLHTILSKRKVLLDQLRKGLETLGVLEEAAKRPLMFESFFVSSDENLTSDKVKGSLTFPGDMDDDQVQTMAYFLQFVDECTKEDLKDLIRFITGSTPLPSSRKIEVQFDVTDGCIFASTCLMQIHLPSKFDTYDTLKMALTTVVLRDEKSSNAM
ncbi:G2/M phase-specific E3 ubiquitin-protein ligase [Acropora cervicornis]|uniref:G2/M phase-specific E3 ubiquitin-protein ligase n=1 Tax=Acropora cervicornis TaxID=6130 RepID=A0AAD9QP02_ACRCE|nr:G2/M phase-specific E3 ubiquitin-protein ligase [Acropora cervicornis]